MIGGSRLSRRAAILALLQMAVSQFEISERRFVYLGAYRTNLIERRDFSQIYEAYVLVRYKFQYGNSLKNLLNSGTGAP